MAFFRYYLASLINAVTGFASLYLLSHNLSANEYGSVGRFMSTVGLITYAASACATGLIGIKFRILSGVDFKKYIRQYRSSAVVLSLLTYFIVGIFSLITGVVPIYMVTLAAAYTVFQLQWTITGQVKIHAGESSDYLKTSSIIALLTLVATYFLVGKAHLGDHGRFYALIIGCAVPVLMSVPKDEWPGVMWVEWGGIREMFNFGAPLIVGAGAGWILYHADKFLVGAEFGNDIAGAYTYAASLASLFALTTSSIDNVFVPKLYMALSDPKSRGWEMQLLLKKWILLDGVVAVGIYFAIFLFLHFLGGGEYVKYTKIVMLIAVAYAILPMSSAFGAVLEFNKENALRTKIYYCAALIYLVSSYLLISYAGPSAFAMGLILSHIGLLVLNIWFAKKSVEARVIGVDFL